MEKGLVKPPLYMEEVDNYAMATYENGKLLILNHDPDESTVFVYDLGNDIDAGKTKASLVVEYNTGYLSLSKTLNITSFDLAMTDSGNITMVVLTNHS